MLDSSRNAPTTVVARPSGVRLEHEAFDLTSLNVDIAPPAVAILDGRTIQRRSYRRRACDPLLADRGVNQPVAL